MTKVGLYAIGKSTTLESNKSPDAYAIVTVLGMGNGVYTSWAQNEG